MTARTGPVNRTARSLLLFLLLLALGSGATPWPAGAEPVVLLGLYPPGSLQTPGVVETVPDVDTWLVPTGKQVSIVGDFMDIEVNPDFNIPAELDGAWNRGYVPFVNLAISHPTVVTAGGALDAAIHQFAHDFALWTQGGQKRAFIALMQEMNGDWTVYHGDPPSFIVAFRRVRQIFEQELAAEGVSSRAISWVFAPNGWSVPGQEFERYYPGDDVVDIVSFSAYNYGSCAGNDSWVKWETYDTTILPYLDRMRVMAPGKPIFLAETAVASNAAVNGVGDKDQWLYDVFTKLAAYPAFRGAVYFNLTNTQANLPGCAVVDYRLHEPGKPKWMGFWNAMADTPNYVFWAPSSPEMKDIVFGRAPAAIFADVPTIHPFALDAGQVDWAPWIHALYNAGITGGCDTNPLRYCPVAGVTRGQMAVFLMRALQGRNYSPPPVTTTRFADVPGSHPFAAWIEAFAGTGITGGCATNPLQYCPDDVVTRAQMAVFLMRAMFGTNYIPPPATGIFSDVPAGTLFAPWIEALEATGVTGGCGPGQYCPNNAVSREQMAVFLVRAFALPK
jgi:hypothetical protein